MNESQDPERKPPLWRLILSGLFVALIVIGVSIFVDYRSQPPPPPPSPTPAGTPSDY